MAVMEVMFFGVVGCRVFLGVWGLFWVGVEVVMNAFACMTQIKLAMDGSIFWGHAHIDFLIVRMYAPSFKSRAMGGPSAVAKSSGQSAASCSRQGEAHPRRE